MLDLRCPDCNSDENVVKHGLRDSGKGTVQRYFCKVCRTSFSDSKNPYTKYPENVIMYTLEQYNRGYPVRTAKKRTGKKYQFSPPVQTIYSWINRYQETLTFLKLRKKYNIDSTNLTTIRNGNEDEGERHLGSSPPPTTTNTNKFTPSLTTTSRGITNSSSFSDGDPRNQTQHPLKKAPRTPPLHQLDPQDYVRGSRGASVASST